MLMGQLLAQHKFHRNPLLPHWWGLENNPQYIFPQIQEQYSDFWFHQQIPYFPQPDQLKHFFAFLFLINYQDSVWFLLIISLYFIQVK